MDEKRQDPTHSPRTATANVTTAHVATAHVTTSAQVTTAHATTSAQVTTAHVTTARVTTAHVITVSDRGSRGEREDKSGPRAVERLQAHGLTVGLSLVPDGADSVSAAIRAALDEGVDVIITTGGTGVGPRDLTPEGTAPLLTKEIPGIAEELRRVGATKTPMAVLSRGLAGIAGATLVVNLPGSVKAVDEGMDVLLPILTHVTDQLGGGDH